jgi:hypothetical protein
MEFLTKGVINTRFYEMRRRERAAFRASAIISDGDAAIGLHRYSDDIAMSSERFIDGVINDLKNKMMQASLRGGADIHAWPLAYGVLTVTRGNLTGLNNKGRNKTPILSAQ